MHNIPVFYRIILALQPKLAFLLSRIHGAGIRQILVGHHFRADETTLEIGMDNAGGLRSFCPFTDGPGTNLCKPRRSTG